MNLIRIYTISLLMSVGANFGHFEHYGFHCVTANMLP